MNFLHTSDWHLGKSFYDFSLLEDQAYFIRQLLEYLAANPVDAVIIAGDIYDRPVPSAAAVQLYDHFLSGAADKLGIPVLAIAGNHDSASRIEFGSSLYAKSGYYVAGSVQFPPQTATLTDAHGPVSFTMIPYLHPAEVRALFPDASVKTFDDAYRTLLAAHSETLDPEQRHVAIAHGFFSNLGAAGEAKELLTSDSEINVGGIDIADSACFAPFDYTALGHLHAPQQVMPGVGYSGSPLKYSLSEETQHKSVTLVTLGEKGNITTQAVVFPPLQDVRTVSGKLEQLLEPSFHQNRRFDDYVFANIAGPESLYPMQKLRTLFPHLLGLRFGDRELGAVHLAAMRGEAVAKLSAQELFCRFYRQCKGYDIPEDQLKLLQEILLEDEEVRSL